MKNNKKTVISTIAASAILVSIFAFNSNANQLAAKQTVADNKPIEASVSDTASNKLQNPVAQAVATALESLKSAVPANNKHLSETSNSLPAKINTAKLDTVSLSPTVQNSANCPKTNATSPNTNSAKATNNQQTNTASIKAKLDDILKAYRNSLSASTSKPAVTSAKPSTATAKPAAGTTSKPASSTTNGDYSAFAKKVVELVNAERAKAGLKPLKMNTELSKVATIKSQDMAKNNYFDHNSPAYGSPFDMMRKFGISYRTAGENIAMGQTSPEQVMNGWMNSPGHRANILKASFTEIGVGIAKNSNGRLYWTQQFIG